MAPTKHYKDGDTFVRAVDYIIDATDPGEAHAILDANAMALFGLSDQLRPLPGDRVLNV